MNLILDRRHQGAYRELINNHRLTTAEWSNWFFTDESAVAFGGGSVTVWCEISSETRTELPIESMNGRRHHDLVLQ